VVKLVAQIILFFIILILVVFLFTRFFYPEWYFDTGHRELPNELEANYIAFGSKGNPSQTDYPLSASDIPRLPLNGVKSTPRLEYILGCLNFKLPKRTEGVFVLTDFKTPTQVLVSIPPIEGGGVDICIPEGTEAYIIIWAKIKLARASCNLYIQNIGSMRPSFY